MWDGGRWRVMEEGEIYQISSSERDEMRW